MGAHPSTPSNKHHDPTAPPKPDGTANSAFFQVLPAELRRRVLIASFGGRTLHPQQPSCVCLSRDVEVLRSSSPAAEDSGRCGELYPALLRDKSKPWVIGVMGWLLCCRQG